ncbi:hypothetical protein GW860_14540 [bacterium]|nr:hypothetical protein [bacterium]NCP10095.1 hypothetical protein [bacterium]
MEKTKNNNVAIFNSKIHCIGKSSEKTPAEVTIHLLIKEGISSKFTGAGVEHPKKFLSKTIGLFLVP